jgi:hypothetical protein
MSEVIEPVKTWKPYWRLAGYLLVIANFYWINSYEEPLMWTHPSIWIGLATMPFAVVLDYMLIPFGTPKGWVAYPLRFLAAHWWHPQWKIVSLMIESWWLYG